MFKKAEQKKERPDPPPTYKVERTDTPEKNQIAVEVTATPQQIADFNPENIEWEEFTSQKGKQTWRHPFQGQKVQGTKDYHNLRNAILALREAGKRYLSTKDGEFYYFISDTDKATIFKQKKQPRKWQK